MNVVDLYATRGMRIYIGMPSIDFLSCIQGVPDFIDAYPDSAEHIEMVQKAITFRTRAEQALDEAKQNLSKANDDKIYYDKELINNIDKFLCQVQTLGAFMSDGMSPVPQYAIPQQNITSIYQNMQKENMTPNYVNQIWEVIPNAEDLVETRTRQLEAAKDLEEKVVRTCIYKMLYTHV